MWQFHMELVAESTCIPEGLKWIVCRKGGDFCYSWTFLLLLSVLVITTDLNKIWQLAKPKFLQVTPAAWLNAKILLGSSYIDKKIIKDKNCICVYPALEFGLIWSGLTQWGRTLTEMSEMWGRTEHRQSAFRSLCCASGRNTKKNGRTVRFTKTQRKHISIEQQGSCLALQSVTSRHLIMFQCSVKAVQRAQETQVAWW